VDVGEHGCKVGIVSTQGIAPGTGHHSRSVPFYLIPE